MSTKRVGTRSRAAAVVPEETFAEVVSLIEPARQRAFQAVNTELVGLYWQIGEYISGKLSAAEWGEGVVDRLAEHLGRTVPGVRGFSAQNLWRMRQFFETYRGDPKLSPLVRVLPWTHNLIILAQSKRPEEREFYLRMAVQERWGKRELERQFRLGAFEKAALAPAKTLTGGESNSWRGGERRLQGHVHRRIPRPACRITARPICTAGWSTSCGPFSSSWAATFATSARSFRYRWAAATSRSTFCSSTAD